MRCKLATVPSVFQQLQGNKLSDCTDIGSDPTKLFSFPTPFL